MCSLLQTGDCPEFDGWVVVRMVIDIAVSVGCFPVDSCG